MDKETYNIFSKFGNLKELTEFFEQLTEAESDGQEISRGMNPNDKSKEQKAEAADAGGDTPVDAAPAGEEAAPEGAVIDPVSAPGSQVSIGNKVKNTVHAEPKAKAIKLSGESDEIKFNPKVRIDDKPGTFN